MLRVELRKKVCTVVISLAKEGSKDLVETKTGGRLEFCCCYLVDFAFAETESECDKYEQLTSLFKQGNDVMNVRRKCSLNRRLLAVSWLGEGESALVKWVVTSNLAHQLGN
jgi:hypothetical protein